MEKILDCQGLACPEPVLRCRALVRGERPAVLRVLVDNAAAAENVSRFLTGNGYSVTARQEGATLWQIGAVAGDASAATGAAASTPRPDGDAPTPDAERNNGRILVLITTETLGRGDDALGARLMDSFLGSLPELGGALWRVVLLNGGVRLAARPGKALESLQGLARAGVGVFVCGTCLTHYGLTEAKQVGETTNMLDIVTSLELAGKVIRP